MKPINMENINPALSENPSSKSKKYLYIGVGLVALIAALVIAILYMVSNNASQNQGVQNTPDQSIGTTTNTNTQNQPQGTKWNYVNDAWRSS